MESIGSSAANQGFYAHAAKFRAAMAGGGGCGAEAAGPARPAAVPYLEQSRNPVTSRIIACRCGCKSRFCESCCLQLGIKLKQRLIPALQTFRRVMMLTFTIDPQHFASPAEAFEHVKQARCLSVTMQALRRAGVLLSDRWFAVIEWQEKGWPHWHVLVEADRIPFETLRDAWNVNLRKLGKVAAETRVGFGSVRFTVSKFSDGKHAAGYACAYLTKHPKDGYPEWVMQSQTRKVHRYSASRDFWKISQDEPTATDEPTEHEDDASGEGADDATAVDDVEQRQRRTIAAQLAECGQMTVILKEIDEADAETGEIVRRYEFIEKIGEPLERLLARVPHADVNARRTRATLVGDRTWMHPKACDDAPRKTVRQFFATPKCDSAADLLLPVEPLSELDELVHWWGWRQDSV